MKKYIIVAVLLSIFLLLLFSCGKKEQAESTEEQMPAASDHENGDSAGDDASGRMTFSPYGNSSIQISFILPQYWTFGIEQAGPEPTIFRVNLFPDSAHAQGEGCLCICYDIHEPDLTLNRYSETAVAINGYPGIQRFLRGESDWRHIEFTGDYEGYYIYNDTCNFNSSWDEDIERIVESVEFTPIN